MQFNNKSIEILSSKEIFGKTIARVRFLTTGEVAEVPLSEIKEEPKTKSLNFLQYMAIAARIKNELSTQSILAPYESNVIPLPHQILALEKIMKGSYCRYLIADEVGMGKTIEAGLVLKELKLRGLVKRTLIIVPLSATTQWQSELKKHFNEKFHIYDTEFITSMIKTCTNREFDNNINLWQQNNQIIVSMDSLRPLDFRKGWSKEKIEQYNKHRVESVINAEFDLLIIDEAHKVSGSDNTVGRFKMAQTLCSAIPNVLLLSATPHRGKSDHFRRIMKLLNEDAFSGEEMPSLEELDPYVVRTEKRNALDYNGNTLFNQRETKRLYVSYDEYSSTLQQKLYDSVTEYVKKGFALATKNKNNSYAFIMILFQRMVSSSTQAIYSAIEKRASRLESEREQVINAFNMPKQSILLNENEIDFTANCEETMYEQIENASAAYDTELAELKSLLTKAKYCQSMEVDIKLMALLNKIQELKTEENNNDLKFIIFTEFTATQEMLCKELKDRGGFSCVAINGSMDSTERRQALKIFKEEAQILVSTDAAGESLNMQFAHIVINYDIPWNPMIIEQRIGRVDRIGQKKLVKAFNMIINNSIDSRVYEVIETKLDKILIDMGIDKTNDVLDSTLEINSVNKLYRTSLLDPNKFEEESNEWLSAIKAKLSNYKATEKLLPSTDPNCLNVNLTDKVKHSPLKDWLQKMTEFYLKDKNIPFILTENGLTITQNTTTEPQSYTFDTQVALNDPSKELLTVQSDLIQKILKESISINKDFSIPVISVSKEENAEGIFMLWNVIAHNAYDKQNKIIPLFISNNGEYFAPYSNYLWKCLSMGELEVKNLCFENNSEQFYQKMQSVAERYLQSIYEEMEKYLHNKADSLRTDKEKAFAFQIKQIKRLGIETIKTYRLNKYNSEYNDWIGNYDVNKQVIPELECLLMLKVKYA